MSEIIVSFTSYPERILTIGNVLDSIINQTILPNRIVLYLSLDEFENYTDMPDLKKYEKYGFEIHWHKENLKSHKKWFYAFQEYPDDIIITIDDDILYNVTALEKLLNCYKLFPKAVIARRAHLITCSKDYTVASYNDWYTECSLYVGVPRMDLFATTGAGTLYPPHVFGQEIFDKKMFMKICPYADDIWMKVMEVYRRVPVVLAEKVWEDYVFSKYQKDSLYYNHNRNGGNDEQLKAVLKRYMYTYDGDDLEMNIFSRGRTMCSEINVLKNTEMQKVLDELLLKIPLNDKLLVYGAGMVGKRLFKWLKYNKYQNIEAFIVSETTDIVDYIDTVPVKRYTEYIHGPEKIVVAILDIYDCYEVYKKLIDEGVDENRIVLLNRLEKQALIKMKESDDKQLMDFYDNKEDII